MLLGRATPKVSQGPVNDTRIAKTSRIHTEDSPFILEALDQGLLPGTRSEKQARKLSNKEQEAYEGPVHYVLHNAVLRPEKKEYTCPNCFQFVLSIQRTFTG